MFKKKVPNFLAGMLAGVVLITTMAFTPNYFEISKQLDIFTNIFKEISLYYVDETEPGQLMEEAITSMLASLDPYTNYIPEERVEDFKIQHTGNYGGIGASIREYQGKMFIATPYEGFAADKAGLQAGDIILSIDGKSVDGRTSDQVSEILKGAPGTKFQISVKRNDQVISKEIEREEVHVNSVPYAGMLENGVGYISLSSFTQNASQEIKDAWKKLEEENEVKSLILDLRNNPGGLLAEAINVTNLFIDKGKEVVQTKGKMEEWQRTYKTLKKAENTEIPLAILINSGSASASEIVAGTLQDYDRAVVIGQRSFGKGLVQETRQLPYGSQVKITIAKYYTPSGRLIQAIDYAERAEDGSVAKIPDSLRTRFETESGRPVFDGGGIDPDIKTEQPEAADVLLALYRDMHLFEYATKYKNEHASIPGARDFEISEAEYAEFKKWLTARNFTFTTKTGKMLDQLQKAAEQEGYAEKMNQALVQVEERYNTTKANDLDEHKVFIKQLLAEEIASRYYYNGGRIANSLRHDYEVDAALEVLSNSNKYQSILSVASAE